MACTQRIDEPLFSDDEDETNDDQPVGYVEFDVKGITKKCAILKEENVIGRLADKGATIIIDDPTVSSVHARITAVDENTFFITDLKSTNGTQVDQVRLSEPYRQYGLRDGAILYFGKVRAKFSMVDAMPIAGVPLPTAPAFLFARSPMTRSPFANTESLLKMATPIDALCKVTSSETSSISFSARPLQTNQLHASSPEKAMSRFDADDVYRSMIEQANKPRADILFHPDTPKSRDVYDVESALSLSPNKEDHHVDPSPSEALTASGKVGVHQRTVFKTLTSKMCNIAANSGRSPVETRPGEGENDVNDRRGESVHHTDTSFDTVQQPSSRKKRRKHLPRSVKTRRSSSIMGQSSQRRSREDEEYKYSGSSDLCNTEAQRPRRSARLAANGGRRIVDFGIFFDFVESNGGVESYQDKGSESDDDIPLAVMKKRLKRRDGDENGLRMCPSNDEGTECTAKKKQRSNCTMDTPKRFQTKKAAT
uniref:FHA domain-containing protein n=1 Tax=Parascaris univalens TaxID=6257 RepID=A0A915AMJ2_PARUN